MHKIALYLRAVFLFAAVIFVVVPDAHSANNEAVGAALEKLIRSGNVDTGSSTAKADWKNLFEFYKSRSFKPVWSRDSGPKGKARALVAELKSVPVHGLSSVFYNLAEIKKLMKSKKPAQLARMDLLLTGALVDFGNDLTNGRVRGAAHTSLNAVKPALLSPTNLVNGAAAAGNLRRYLGAIVGDDRRYLRLISKLVEFIRLSKSPLWKTTKISNRVVGIGRAGKHIPLVREKLVLLGDLPIDQMNKVTKLDKKLSVALRRYQKRHGLMVTGSFTKQVAAKLNDPLAKRIAQLKLNLERRRWENRAAAKHHAYINLADGKLKLTLSDKTSGLLTISSAKTLTDLPSQYGAITGFRIEDGEAFVSTRLVSASGAKTLERGIKLSGSRADIVGAFKKTLPADVLQKLRTLAEGDKIDLRSPIELYVTYLTAWADRRGVVSFRSDDAKRDPKLATALALTAN